MEFGVTFWTAFIAGVATFFSPCTLPILPGFFALLSGKSAGQASRWRVVRGTLVFVMGFTLMFVLLGIGANFLGKPLLSQRGVFEKVGGVLIMLFGLMLLGVLHLPSFQFLRATSFRFLKSSSVIIQDFFVGLTFGFAGVACTGPIWGTILFLATGEKTAIEGGYLLFVFSLGLALPFLISAFFVPELKKVLKKLSLVGKYTQHILGLLLLFIGIVLFFGKLESLSVWLIH